MASSLRAKWQLIDFNPRADTQQNQHARNDYRPQVDMKDTDIVRGPGGGCYGDQFQYQQYVSAQSMPLIDTLPLFYTAEDKGREKVLGDTHECLQQDEDICDQT